MIKEQFMKIKVLVLMGLLSVGIVPKLWAKDLSERIGAGFNSQIGINQHLDAASARYWFNKDMGIQGDFAFLNFSPNNGSSQTSFGLGGKFLYNVMEEANMNLYTGAGLYVFNQPVSTATGVEMKTGFSLGALGGIEFFFQGLPNLGFNLELDLGVKYLDGYGTAFGISADTINAGIHYYF